MDNFPHSFLFHEKLVIPTALGYNIYSMKTTIHAQYYPNAKVTCSCGNTFTIGSTVEVIHVELCSKCHPFYTGEQRFVDAASKIQRFQQKQERAKAYVSKKVAKVEKQKERDSQPKTLREMLAAMR